ncbi:hypothetical protein BHE74_00036244, partial [Ensete ventricosum]
NASIGGVCRDHEGLFMLGYAECIGRATSSVAELAACKRGLELALQNGWHSLWVEGDAKMVVDVFTNEVRLKSKEDLKIAREIRVLIPQLNDFTVSHIYRQGNRVAHNFAKLGYRYQKPQIWRGIPPNEVERLLHGIHIYRCSAASISIKSPGDHRHLDAVAPRVAVAVAAAAAALPLPQGLLTTRGWAPRCGPQTCGHLPEWVNDGTLTSQVNRLRQATNDATTLADFRHSPEVFAMALAEVKAGTEGKGWGICRLPFFGGGAGGGGGDEGSSSNSSSTFILTHNHHYRSSGRGQTGQVEGGAAAAPAGRPSSGASPVSSVARSLLPTRRRLRLDPPTKLYFVCECLLCNCSYHGLVDDLWCKLQYTFLKQMEKLKRQLAEAEAALEARKKPLEDTGPRIVGGLVIDEWKERRERYLAQQQQVEGVDSV